MGDHPWIDTSRERIYVLTIPGSSALIESQGASFITSFRAMWEGISEPLAIVTDLSSVMALPPALRKATAEIDREMFEKQRRLCLAWGVVIKSDVQRMIFQGYLWIAPPASPYCVCPTRDAAMVWVRGELARAGVKASGARGDVGKVLASARSLAESVQDRKPR